ncbi:MAG: aminotransferase class IV [Limnochordia bacterium]|jgi:D-alanine transaminase
MPVVAWVNGEYVDINRPAIAIEDRGYQFGDGVYEVIRLYQGQPFALKEHLERLEKSLAAIELELPKGFSMEDLVQLVQEGAQKSEFDSAFVYLQVSRGVRERDHSIPAQNEPVLVMTVRPFIPHTPEAWEEGMAAVTLPDERWLRCDIKTTNLLPNVLAISKAEKMGADEAILVREGVGVTECTRTNLFMVRDGCVYTAPTGRYILPGISRQIVLKLMSIHRLPYREQFFTADALAGAEEIFTTGTGREVFPVTSLNGRPVGNGLPGAMTRKLAELFRGYVQETLGERS